MSVLLDEDTLVIEGLEFEIPCEKVGDHAAELAVSCRGCGYTTGTPVRRKDGTLWLLRSDGAAEQLNEEETD